MMIISKTCRSNKSLISFRLDSANVEMKNERMSFWRNTVISAKFWYRRSRRLVPMSLAEILDARFWFFRHQMMSQLIEHSQVQRHWLIERSHWLIQLRIQSDMIWSQCFENRSIQMIIRSCRSHHSCSAIWMIRFTSYSRVRSKHLNWLINRVWVLLLNRLECSERLQLDVQFWIFWLQSWLFRLSLLVIDWWDRWVHDIHSWVNIKYQQREH
jgi:hypothetical protein